MSGRMRIENGRGRESAATWIRFYAHPHSKRPSVPWAKTQHFADIGGERQILGLVPLRIAGSEAGIAPEPVRSGELIRGQRAAGPGDLGEAGFEPARGDPPWDFKSDLLPLPELQ